MTATDYFRTPVGVMCLTASGKRLLGCVWVSRPMDNDVLVFTKDSDAADIIRETRRQLTEYFNGIRTDFNLPLVLNGTPFQNEVWNALRNIAYGETASYNNIAQAIGRPSSSRAVANAIGANPFPVIIPCHRIIRSDGSEGGYSGPSGAKHFLLELEKKS